MIEEEQIITITPAWHVRVWRRYQESWFDRHFRFSLPVAVALFAFAMFVNFWAINQATYRAGAAVPDIILSNIPVFEVDGLFVYGTFVFVVFAAVVLFPHPKRIPFALHALTLFILIRSAAAVLALAAVPST